MHEINPTSDPILPVQPDKSPPDKLRSHPRADVAGQRKFGWCCCLLLLLILGLLLFALGLVVSRCGAAFSSL